MKCSRLKSILAVGIFGAGFALSATAAEMLIDQDLHVGPNPGTGHLSSSFFDVFTELSFDGTPPSFFDVHYEIFIPAGDPNTVPVELVQLSLVSLEPIHVNYSGTIYSPTQWTISGQTGANGSIGGLQDLGGGNFRIDSFFDIFTELTFDGSGGPITIEKNSSLRIVTGEAPSVPDPASTWLLVLIPAGLLGLARRFWRA